MHLQSLRPTPAEPEKVAPEHAEGARTALRYLNETPRRRRQVQNHTEFSVNRTVQAVLDNMQQMRETGDRRDFVARRMADLRPWGDFRFPRQDGLKGYYLWFYRVPHKDMAAVRESGLTWQVVHTSQRFCYVVVLSKNEPVPEDMPVPRTHTGPDSLSQLQLQLNELDIRLEELVAEREALTRWIYLLTRRFNRAEDQASRRHAEDLTLDTEDGMFALQGWVPRALSPEVEKFAVARGLAMLVERPGAEDNPPTLMHNPDKLSGGEGLVKFYQTPGYRDWDPSTIVFFSFALFFAMILADAGYALVLSAGLATFWGHLGGSDTGRRARVLLAVIFATSVAFGVLVGSYFGVEAKPGSLLGALHVLDLNDYDTMMKLSVTIGCVHIALASAMAARHSHDAATRNGHLAWIGMVAGGLLIWLGSESPLATAGIALVIAALLTLLLFASNRPVHGPEDAVKRLLDGLLKLSNVTKVFGDVLSYLRLFALGLASASLAVTFNQLAKDIHDALHGGPGLLFAIVVLLLGHTLNLGLGIMSAVVHGLRLNVIEFFNWGLSDEGYPFRPYAKKEAE
jgi:V/A-type H+-transporting ATPase subunit I